MAEPFTVRRLKPYLLLCVLLLIMVYLNRNADDRPSRSSAEQEAFKTCEALVRQRAAFPSSVDVHYVTGMGSDLSGAGGKPRVAFNFDAKNAFGNMLPYQASCDFGSDPPSVIVTKR
ncbi:hypothetical protein [Pseudomonas huanghezhanensis]|uniref:hypothetical protein n=1 Tax=Pseudomonas huanghezhanensis TaxID=3002903 RepID=UPI002285762B|nr:hypothetical protein [Pseudomonas sp. BSw22131]